MGIRVPPSPLEIKALQVHCEALIFFALAIFYFKKNRLNVKNGWSSFQNFYLCLQKNILDLISLILPKEVLEHFSLTCIEESIDQVDLYLEELSIRPQGDGVYLSKGFTPYSIIQDYPLRGRAVYLHVRRRKWYEPSTGSIVIREFDIAHQGTRLSKEFAAFLKELDRLQQLEHKNNR